LEILMIKSWWSFFRRHRPWLGTELQWSLSEVCELLSRDWGLNFCSRLFTTFWHVISKKPVKSHVFWNVKNTKNTYPRTLTHAGCLPRNRRSAPALSLWSEVQIVCIWSHWCHCHPKTPSSLASFKSTLVLPFWYRLTQVVLEKTPLNGCSVYSKVR